MRTQQILYQQTDFPLLQNRVYSNQYEALNSPVGDICLVNDLQSGLVYNSAFQPDLVKYNSEYDNEQSHSILFQQHLEQVSFIIEQTLGKQNLCEIGCGKGYFLHFLRSCGFEIFGCDPAYDGNSKYISSCYFSDVFRNGAKKIILRHVLEHVAEPFEFLQSIASNYPGALIYIEVPCWQWICQKRAWFDIYYEHVNYFSISDFFQFFKSIIAYGKLFADQYIYVVADLNSLQKPKYNLQNQVEFPKDFINQIVKHKDLSRREKSVIWGGASKGVIYSLLLEKIGHKIDYIIDVNPAKQGKFTAKTAIPIISPALALEMLTPNETVVVMNENYLSEISQLSKNKFNLIGVSDVR